MTGFYSAEYTVYDLVPRSLIRFSLTGNAITSPAASNVRIDEIDDFATPNNPTDDKDVRLGDIGQHDDFVTAIGGAGATTSYKYIGNWDYFDANGDQFFGFVAQTVNPVTGQDVYRLFVPEGNPPPPISTVRVDPYEERDPFTHWDLKEGAPGCFVAGTLIATPSGQRAVESLVPGDLVLAADGRAMPVRWVGRSTANRAEGKPLLDLPIIVRAGAFGENLPARDLGLSAGHAILLDGVLVNAAALVNGTSVVRDWSAPETYTYYHLELDTHAVILAEGLEVESFLGGAEDRSFDNWAERVAPGATEELPHPRAFSARQVPAGLRRKVEARAEAAFVVAQAA